MFENRCGFKQNIYVPNIFFGAAFAANALNHDYYPGAYSLTDLKLNVDTINTNISTINSDLSSARGKTRGEYKVMKLMKKKKGGGNYAVFSSPEKDCFLYIFIKSLLHRERKKALIYTTYGGGGRDGRGRSSAVCESCPGSFREGGGPDGGGGDIETQMNRLSSR
jgi:uncharacterized membrane protein YgcG